ncbi:CCT3 [Mytilus coruscus]|uniref:T-complex protein 1 subunit gamma n=1 Tax=Mytilus coruscus TaxID=42192 RepID=A0A6J8CHI9_MYTCO|nr:CCT3 [Mytilus coruscus]
MGRVGDKIKQEIAVLRKSGNTIQAITGILRTRGHNISRHSVRYWLRAYDRGFISELGVHVQQNNGPSEKFLRGRELIKELIKSDFSMSSKQIHKALVADGANMGLSLTKIAIDAAGFTHSRRGMARWSELACNIALDATATVALEENGRKEIDIKRYAKVEKIPGGTIEDSQVLRGVMLNKDVVHPKMKRRIEKPKILLLDCNLEYKKGESQTNIEITKEEDFTKILKMEEDYIEKICAEVIQFKPDLIITEKGVSDLAQHFLVKAGISVIRRVRKSDNNRIARACGATIVNRTDEIREDDLGTGCGLFYIEKFGDEYFTFLVECENPKACTILLRGASKDILNEVERNLQDAMNVARNVMVEPKLVAGGGASEMALAQAMNEKAKAITGVSQWPYRAVARALEVIPRTLIQNCGANPIRTLTALRAKHASPDNTSWGIDGENGKIVDMKEYGIWEPFSVKVQTLKTALETAMLLLRIDDIVSGTKKQADANAPAKGAPEAQASEGPEP